MRVCHCTNQCPACGQCCAVGCAHRGGGRTFTYPNTTPLPPIPVGPQPPLTDEDIRRIARIIREELGR